MAGAVNTRASVCVCVRLSAVLLTSVLQVVVVLLIFNRQVGLAAQRAQCQQSGASARHRREARRLQA